MSKTISEYAETIYAGVLGKIIGVYLGRPVEGWSYPEIRDRFDEINYYVNVDLGEPLVVIDDDISGTFAFFRTLEDNPLQVQVTAKEIGDTWLNYIIENRTILWWGGLGRSTEHTAFLRLKAGINAPESGSIALNGRTLAEQVGAQIFSDAFALVNPGDPDRAAALVREAASVSHDGVALDAAAFLGAIRALAFDISSLPELIEQCRKYVHSPLLHTLIDDMLRVCQPEADWRSVRWWIDRNYGYQHFSGACHIVPNHAMTLASLLLGGDNFRRSLMIATSAGMDTDSNAGVVGCINGIRLGLDAITKQVDFRSAISDRLFVATADGGSCVSDAVQETNRIVRAASLARSENVELSTARFCFAYRGSTQGFESCPYLAPESIATITVGNANEFGLGSGLIVDCAEIEPGTSGFVSTPVFLDSRESADQFERVASPTLYPGELIRMRFSSANDLSPNVNLYVVSVGSEGEITTHSSARLAALREACVLEWMVPPIGGSPLLRLGVKIDSPGEHQGRVVIHEIDWSGGPARFEQSRNKGISTFETKPYPLFAWVSSAHVFEPDSEFAYSISHSTNLGLVTIGSREWKDYSVSSTLKFSLHQLGGVVVRSIGHRRFYAAAFDSGTHLSIFKQVNNKRILLSEVNWAYEQNVEYQVEVRCLGAKLQFFVDGKCLLEAQDDLNPYLYGGAGFIAEYGTLLADGFLVSASVSF